MAIMCAIWLLALHERDTVAAMAYLLGVQRGLSACASPSGRFMVLALDHRQNLRKELSPEDPAEATFEQMTAFKEAVVEALARAATGTLLDPEVGAARAIASGALPPGAGLIVAIEATGYEGPTTARISRVLPGWSIERAKRLGASAAKLLVYYHPDAPNEADQRRFVERVARECLDSDLPLFVEPLSFSVDERPLQGEERRRVVVETARRLMEVGGDVLKAEFPYDASVSDHTRWLEACTELDAASSVPWVLLSGGVDDETFEAQVEIACEAGASGVLVGRSVWAPAARLAGPDRDRWLNTEGRARLERLVAVAERAGHPWRDRWLAAKSPDQPGEGWYHGY
jgi:tagatose 1,6-diphosphate aldolase